MPGAVSVGSIPNYTIIGSVPSNFSPDGLPGLAFWAAARLESGLAGGDSVVTITDRSGEGNDLTGAAVENRPTYQTAIIGTQPVYRFDGTNDYMRRTTLTNMTNWTQSDHAIIVVIRPTSVVEEDLLSSSNSGDGNDLLMVISTGRGHSWRGVGDANAINTTTTLLVNTNYILMYWVSGTQNAIYLNGTLEAGPTNLTGTAGTGTDQIFVGNRSGVYGPGWYSGEIAEVLIYTTAPTDGQMLQLSAWLNSIYGVY